MNASDTQRLRKFYEQDVETAIVKLQTLIDSCTHIFEDGKSAIEQPAQDNNLLEQTCAVCEVEIVDL